jgi:MFS family permease
MRIPKLRKPSGALWSHPDFMKMWTGQTISQFGSSISELALPIIAVRLLDASAFEVAALGVVEFAPFLLFTLPAGVWVDRLPRRAVLIAGDVGRGLLLCSVPIAYLTGHLTLAQLFVVGFLTGILTVFFDVAYQSYLPALVPREHLIEGNSKLEVTRSAGQLAGPPAAGGLIQLLTAPYAIVWDSVSFFISGAFLLAIRKKEQPLENRDDGRRAGMRHELWEGLLYVVKHPYLRPQAISTGVSNFFSNVAFSIVIVFAIRTLHMSNGLIGVVFGLGAIGWLGGAALAPRCQRWLGVGGATILGAAMSGPGTLLVALTPKSFPVPFLVAGTIIGGAGAVIYNIQQVSLRQAITPERMQGRMNSVMRFLVWGPIPLGGLVGGALATTFGLRTALVVGALGGFTSTLPIIFSPIRKLTVMPEPEEPLPAVAAGEAGLAPTVTSGIDESGAIAGAGAAAAIDEAGSRD